MTGELPDWQAKFQKLTNRIFDLTNTCQTDSPFDALEQIEKALSQPTNWQARALEAEEANKRANSLIGAQAEENDKLVKQLQSQLTAAQNSFDKLSMELGATKDERDAAQKEVERIAVEYCEHSPVMSWPHGTTIVNYISELKQQLTQANAAIMVKDKALRLIQDEHLRVMREISETGNSEFYYTARMACAVVRVAFCLLPAVPENCREGEQDAGAQYGNFIGS